MHHFFSVILSPFAHSPCTLSTSPQWKLLNYTPTLVWICGATNNNFIRNQLQCCYTNSLESIYQLITMVATCSQHTVLYRETIWLRLPVARQHPGIIPTHPKVGSQHQWCQLATERCSSFLGVTLVMRKLHAANNTPWAASTMVSSPFRPYLLHLTPHPPPPIPHPFASSQCG